jgi:Fic family protein
MSRRDTDQFKERTASVKQVMKSQRHNLLEECEGIATLKQIQEQTGLNDQAVRRIVSALKEKGEAKVVKDKSEIVLFMKNGKD